jgi:chromosome segregation ATPase
MRYLTLIFLAAAAWGQTADPDPRVLQSLLTEVQQLRLAIERSTLLGARTQLAVSKLQMQETRAAQLSRDLANLRDAAGDLAIEKVRNAERLKAAEESRNSPQFSTPEMRNELESQIKQLKLNIEEFGGKESRRAAREGELAVQAQAAQAEVADSRSRIAEMERALDAAIQQLLKRP